MGYENLEKISCVVDYISSKFVLMHHVKVAFKRQNGKRDYFHSEYTYLSNKYIDKKYLKSMKLKFNSYLTIEETGRDWTEKATVIIDMKHLHRLAKLLRKSLKWFYNDKYQKLYYYENGKLHLNADFNDLEKSEYFSNNIVMNIRPTVIELDDDEYEGVNIDITNANTPITLSIDNLEYFYELISNFNLYQAGLGVISYLGRPEFDEYNVDLVNDGYNKDKSNEFCKSRGFSENKYKGFFK